MDTKSNKRRSVAWCWGSETVIELCQKTTVDVLGSRTEIMRIIKGLSVRKSGKEGGQEDDRKSYFWTACWRTS